MLQSATQQPQPVVQGSLAKLTKLTKNWVDKRVHRQNQQGCPLTWFTWTVTKYHDGAIQPLAKKLHQSSQEFSLRQKCALICLSWPFPLHSKNWYAWICSISYNQASADLGSCWTIQVFSSLLIGSCLLKAYHSYLRLKGSHPRKLVKLTSLIWAPALASGRRQLIQLFCWNALLNHESDENIWLSSSFDVI